MLKATAARRGWRISTCRALWGGLPAYVRCAWSWAAPLVSAAEMGELAQCWQQALEALVEHMQDARAGGRSPSDLPLVRLAQQEIETLERRYGEIEDVLPLAPLQEGLLFHALY